MSDVSVLGFDPRTMTCAGCLQQLYKSSDNCFGKRYDGTAVECRQFCMDRKLCKVRGQLYKIRGLTQGARAFLLEGLQKQSAKLDKVSEHPFKTGLLRVAWELALRGTTLDALERLCQSYHSASFDNLLLHLRRGKRYQFRWSYNEDDDGRVWVEWQK